MTIEIVNGDILTAKEDIIGHQVNCQGFMGAGLAKQIRNKHPRVYNNYKVFTNRHTEKELMGSVLLVEYDYGKYIANIYGQRNVGRGVQTDYYSLEAGLHKLADRAIEMGKKVALPYGIGCGLAGGDWHIVFDMIDRSFRQCGVTLYKFQ